MRKLIIAFLLIFTVTTFSLQGLQIANASPYTIATGIASTINVANIIYEEHPASWTSPSTNISASGEVFNAVATGYLTSIRVSVYAITRNGTFKIELLGYTGTYGTTAVPNSTVYSTSDTIYISETGIATFTFPGDYQLVAGTKYAFAVEAVAMDPGLQYHSSYGVRLSETSSSAYGGNSFLYMNGTWLVYDASFNLNTWTVYGTSTAGETPAPLPTGGLDVDTSDADAVMEALIGYGVPVVVMLLPMIFIWLVGGRGKWQMLLGISIGTGIGYLFGLVPVWLVFLISIGVVGFAYQSVRSGN